MKTMTERQDKTHILKDGGKQYRVTLVAPEPRAVVDEAGVLSVLTPAETEFVMKKVLNRSALEVMMDRPEVAERILPHISLKPSTAYLRFTEEVNDDFTPQG